ncbi:VacJ family lipoprotein [Microbulbifer bruguierae]|uniref:VacJ family lipoprotein n=1 Tax=Microbulbifer bruguierae TaxID=3029061 RepID=A0ABY8NBS4_9GAMM|nr:VacJ family lipoprotein [Microbulbifer bruguierae]WGL16376.1 VacJ family lipoprotein [Microbulbifer bruguierae]
MLERTPIIALALTALLSAPMALAQEASDSSDPFAESPSETPVEPVSGSPVSGEDTESSGSDSSGSDPFGSDPFSSGEGEGTGNGAADDFGSELQDEYGFDPAGAFASEEEPQDRDPWEGFNRAMFRFNDTADRWFLKPAATSYRQITPIFVQTGVTNFFSNLHEINNVLNDILQWKWGQAGNDTGRFLLNSTVGLVGLFDVAQHMGLEPSDGEDFGQTLAVWGAPSGPYLVIPFMGPSTVRDVPGEVLEWYTNPLTYVDDNSVEYTLKVLDLLQTRASLLKAESLLQGDRYVLMRDAYLQRREFLINDGEQEDDFGGDLDEYDF